MFRTRPPLVALLVILSALGAAAQQAPEPTPDIARPVTIGVVPPKAGSERNVRVDVTLTLKGGAKPIVKTLSMMARDGGDASARANVEIPYLTGTQTGAGPQYGYRTIGLNADTSPTILASGRIALKLRLGFNTLYRAEGAENSRPSFGVSSHDTSALVFESGKPSLWIQSTDPETGRDYSIDVKATTLP